MGVLLQLTLCFSLADFRVLSLTFDILIVVFLASGVRPHNSTYCSQPDSSVHRILLARILEWVVISFPRASSPSKDRTCCSCMQADQLPLSQQRSPYGLGFGKIYTTLWYHTGQFHYPKNPLCYVSSSFPGNHRSFTISIVLPFSECYIVGIIQCIFFSGWLLSLRNMHLSCFHVFSWLHNSCLQC